MTNCHIPPLSFFGTHYAYFRSVGRKSAEELIKNK